MDGSNSLNGDDLQLGKLTKLEQLIDRIGSDVWIDGGNKELYGDCDCEDCDNCDNNAGDRGSVGNDHIADHIGDSASADVDRCVITPISPVVEAHNIETTVSIK